MRQTAQERQEELIATLLFQVKALGLPEPVREYRLCLGRRWRFDLAWPVERVACEVEGGIWVAGRHVRGGGFEADCEKYNTALCGGVKVLRVTPRMIEDGRAAGWLERLLR